MGAFGLHFRYLRFGCRNGTGTGVGTRTGAGIRTGTGARTGVGAGAGAGTGTGRCYGMAIQWSISTPFINDTHVQSESDSEELESAKAFRDNSCTIFHCAIISSNWGPSMSISSLRMTISLAAFLTACAAFVCECFDRKA